MKRTIRTIAIVLVCCLVFGAAAFAAGSSYTKELTANYVGVQIVVNGTTITPKDANGTVVEPFIVDGTTYLPVRAVAEALGQEVGWDGDTKTVYIGEKPTDVMTPIPEITPEPIPEEVKLTLDRIAFSLKVGETLQVNSTVTPEGTPIVWTSGNPAIATVDDNGLVTAVSGGKADIFAAAGGKEAFCTVTVEDVVSFLKKEVTEKGYYEDGAYQYIINQQYSDEFLFTFSVVYYTKSDELQLRVKSEDPSGNFEVFFYLKDGLPKPYCFSANYEYRPHTANNWYAMGSFDPSLFTATGGPINYSSYSGHIDSRWFATELIQIAVVKSFSILEVNVLLENGYTLAHMGFIAPLYDPEDL